MSNFRSLLAGFNADARSWLLGGCSVLVGYLVLVPLVFLVYGTFFTPTAGGTPGSGEFTLENYTLVYADPGLYRTIWTSFQYALGTAILAVLLATLLAWLVERTNVPGKDIFYALTMGPLIIPGILHTIAWIFLLSPKVGLINVILVNWLGFSGPPFNVYGMPGMIWVEGLHLSPLAFLLVAAAFNSLDPALEEAAKVAGASNLTVLYHITLKLTRPALLAAFLLMFIRGFESFEVPALIGMSKGIHVFTSRIYLALHTYPIDFGVAGALSVLVLVVTGIGVVIYTRVASHGERYSTITGKGFRPARVDLGPWRWPAAAFLGLYFALVFGLPLLILAWASAVPYFTVPSLEMLRRITWENYRFVLDFPLAGRAFANSAVLSVGAATITMMLTALLAWVVVKARLKGRWLLDTLASLPLAYPALVLGVALIWLYLMVPIPLYGTIWILLVAYVTKYLPYGMRHAAAAMVQVHRELEEAAEVSGAGWLTMFRRILVPLLLPGLSAGWIYIVTVSFRELGASVILYSTGSEVMSVVLFDMWDNGRTTEVAALGVMMVLLLLTLSFLLQVVRRRFGLRAAE